MLPKVVLAIREEDAFECKQTAVAGDIEEDGLQYEQTVDDELEKEQNVNMPPIAIPAIQLAEIKDMTDDFSWEYRIVGEYSGGSVFNGVLKSGQDAAIKQLYTKLPDHEFLA